VDNHIGRGVDSMHSLHTGTRLLSLMLIVALIACAVPVQAAHLRQGNIIEPDWTRAIAITAAICVMVIVVHVILSEPEDSPAIEPDDTESVEGLFSGGVRFPIEVNEVGGLTPTYAAIMGSAAKSFAAQSISDPMLLQHSSMTWPETLEPLAARSRGSWIRSPALGCGTGFPSRPRLHIGYWMERVE
jgi:hypothetical protein